MASASAIRLQIESSLARKFPSALTPAPKILRPVAATGIDALDEILQGGLPLGTISEIAGPECSGRTSIALSFLARITKASKLCAWVDVSDVLDPASAAAAGIDLARLLWVRCGVSKNTAPPGSRQFELPGKYLVSKPPIRGLHGGGFGPHPRNETQGMTAAIPGLLHPESFAPRCAEPQHKERPGKKSFAAEQQAQRRKARIPAASGKPWTRMDQALRVADLLLQAGGFSAIVLDLGSIAPEYASRVPLATWFRYRAAAEQTQASILLLTQHSCAKSSAELLLQLQSGNARHDEATIFTGIEHHAEVNRRRFVSTNVAPLRKPPQRATAAYWQSRTTWAGPR